MQREQEEIVLVAGATGRCGRYIVKSLLNKNKKVRILARNMNKVNEVFSESELKQFDGIVLCDLIQNENYKSILDTCFKTKENQTISHVISAMSYRFEKNQTVEQGNIDTNKRLIDACKEYGKVKRFCFISSTHLRRPYSYISYTCNILKRKWMQWTKVQIEDYLRKSGLNYMIIRPVGLLPVEKPSAYTLSQGDKVEGKINIPTVGNIVADALFDQWMPPNVSFECISEGGQFNEPYAYTKGSHHLRSETDEEKKLIDHVWPTRIITVSLWTIFISSVYLSYKLSRRYANLWKFWSVIKNMFSGKAILK
jgi:hypothetical protein